MTALALEDRDVGERGAAGVSTVARDERDVSEEAPLVCAACGHPLTTEADRIEAFGAHVHDRVNPAGVVFRIGVFARAGGAALVGPSSDEFPWFPSHRWRVALCGACFVHVGWSFASASSAFYGLVLDALRAP